MRGLGITPKQRRYAYNIMNTDISRAEAMRQAGYSATSAEHPAKIEKSNGYKLAMASIFAETGNVSMAILNEMQARVNAGELKKIDLKTLVSFYDSMTKSMERLQPKESKDRDNDTIKVFGEVMGNIPSNDTLTDNQSDDIVKSSE